MEILDKIKIKPVVDLYENIQKNFFKIFRKRPTESVGVYIADDYVYFVSVFYDSDNWCLFSFAKSELPTYNYEEKAAKWTREIINKYNLNNAIVNVAAPDKILLKREITLKDIPKENLKEVIYWDYASYYFENNEEFNIVYYPLDDGLYFAAGLETVNQKRVYDFFKDEEISVSNWTTFPPKFNLNMNGAYISIFDKNIAVSSDIDMLKLNEYTPAIYAAMIGANLFEGEDNIIFPPPYPTEFLNYKLIALTVFMLGILSIGGVFVYDSYKIYSLQKELENTNIELQKLSVDKTKMKIYNYISKDTVAREQFLADKTKKRLPFAGVILHLGTLTTDGVILTSVKSDDNKIIIEGEAISEYDMENFFDKINSRKDIFIKSPKSLKVDNKDNIKFSFSINL